MKMRNRFCNGSLCRLGRRRGARIAGARLGKENARPVYWILSAALLDDEEYAMRSFVSVSQKRPEICEGLVHFLRWDSSWTNVGSEALLDEVRSMVHGSFESSDEEEGDSVE